MLSLRDKLKAIGESTKAPPEKREKTESIDCFVCDTAVSADRLDLVDELPEHTLQLMLGETLPRLKREDILFLDTETTGLSHGAGTVAFLIGTGRFRNNEFVVRQYLMRDYDEEPAQLEAVARELADAKAICSYNGKTFDLPLLQTRFTMNRMHCKSVSLPHIDLLPAARRVWKLRLKRCPLTVLEEEILGMKRENDLPGALVPKRYFEFLQSGDFTLLSDILRHNVQDIVSLTTVLSRLLTLHGAPLNAEKEEDLYSLGRVMEKRGEHEQARRCYYAADKGKISSMARLKLAQSYAKCRRTEMAKPVYERMAAAGQGGTAPLIALAKLYEHRLRQYDKALECTRKAIIIAADRHGEEMPELQKRYQRLMKKAKEGR